MLRSARGPKVRIVGLSTWVMASAFAGTLDGRAFAGDVLGEARANRSTLDAQIAPINPELDATISSLVKRGLLGEIPAAPATAVSAAIEPTPADGPPLSRIATAQRSILKRNDRVASLAPAPGSAPIVAPGQWRPASSILKRDAAPPVEPPSSDRIASKPTAAASSAGETAKLGWKPSSNAAIQSEPTNEPVNEPTPAEPVKDAQPAVSKPAVQTPAAPLLLAAPTAVTPTPTVDSPKSNDTNSADDQVLTQPIGADELAPIDELPETPAPADDAPGDGRVDDLGEAKDDAGGAKSPSVAKPLSKATDPQQAPLGEPERIEVRASDAPAPLDPKAYQEVESPSQSAAKPGAPTSGAGAAAGALPAGQGAAQPQTAALSPLTPNQRLLRDKVRRVLKYYYDRPLNTGDRSPWEVMHCMLAYEVHSHVRQDSPQGAPITAVGWLCYNQPCKGRTLMYLNEDQELRVKVGPALQGHQGQLLALLAQAHVRSDYPIKVQGKDFTIADLIEVEKQTCYPRTELTFKLLGLLNYLPMDAQWMNDQGMAWNFPTLIDEEIRQPIRTAACGGMHRLSGLSLSVKKRQKLGLPVDGQYARAAQFVANYQNYAFRLQNADGSFSTEWFRGPGDEPDIDRRLKTTGHTLEWMLYASSEQQMTYFRTVKAVNYLSNIMWANRTRDWEAGPLGHAIHALLLYDKLVFAPHDGEAQQQTAKANRPVAQKQQPAMRGRRR